MDNVQLCDVKKNFIKLMPIWNDVDQYSADFTDFVNKNNLYLNRLEDRITRIGNLWKLNLTNEPKTVVYQPTHESRPTQQPKTRGLKDESILLLEKRIICDEIVYALIKPRKPWVKCRVDSVYRRQERDAHNEPLVIFRLKVEEGDLRNTIKVCKYGIARIQNHGDQLRVPKRVIAGYTKSTMMPGIIGYEPASSNNYRYLVHMDDGSTSYFKPNQIYPILAQTSRPWLDSRNLDSKKDHESEACRRHFFAHFPRRRIMKIDIGDEIDVIRNGAFAKAKVIEKDCDVMRILYRDDTEESIWRGSLRLLKSINQLQVQIATLSSLDHLHHSVLLFAQLYHSVAKIALEDDIYQFMAGFKTRVNISDESTQRARKSTGKLNPIPRKKVNLDSLGLGFCTGPIEDWDANRARELKKHRCDPSCLDIPGVRTELSVGNMIDEFRDASDLKVPLMLGWKRKIYKMPPPARGGQQKYSIGYEAPCGKIFERAHMLRNSLIKIGSKLDIDYFTFELDVKLDTVLGNFEPLYYKENFAIDAKTGRPLENKNISLFNQFSEERLPQDFEYRNESFPHPMLKAKGFSLNKDFRSSCDCEDDCSSRTTCLCHNLNEDAFGQKSYLRGIYNRKCQYADKRLNIQVATGIFECNSGCKCSSKCINRVVQNGIRFRLQVRKTLNKGWGVITLDDIPRGAFICTYAAEILDDADQYGDSDMYYADLDFITINEKAKLGYSDSDNSDDGVETLSGSDEETNWRPDETKKKTPQKVVVSDSSSSISSLDASQDMEVECIEEKSSADIAKEKSRYPKRKINKPQPIQPIAVANNSSQKVEFKSIHDLLDCRDYTLDARMQGNVGRFFNHSCDPNSFVQNVFVETHDLRFPLVAFFAQKNIRASDEITWNYNYKMGSIAGRTIYCHCGASNCKGRIL